ncbi:MAG: hypothetical protein PHW04_00960 [Candidatus Wallbacteria bacterium]|nr:hypothetical protein [Candidatus Wallbacteria bacterium]
MISGSVRLEVPTLCGNLGPGYDTFGLALAHYNYVEMKIIPMGLKVEITGQGAEFLPKDAASVVYKAADLVFEKCGESLSGLEIRLENNIPIGKGLGSFSGAVAAGIFGANQLLRQPFEVEKLISMAARKVGSASNVAAAFLGNFAIVERYAEIYTSFPLPEQMKPVVFVPEVPTFNPQAVRKSIPKKVSLENANFNISHATLLALGMMCKRTEVLKLAFADQLVNSHRMSCFPGIREVFLSLSTAPDTYGVSFCNDGPSFVCFFDRDHCYQEQIKKITRLLKQHQIKVSVIDVPVSTRGITAI